MKRFLLRLFVTCLVLAVIGTLLPLTSVQAASSSESVNQVPQPLASGTCGNNLSWKIVNGVLTISGTGEMKDYGWTSSNTRVSPPWYNWNTYIKSIVIQEGVTSIGNYAFEDCSKATTISIPNTISSIGIDAFFRCAGLTTLHIPDSVTEIGAAAFAGCTNLREVVISNGMTYIPDNVFNNCTSLVKVTIPDSITQIGNQAFSYCYGITEIAIPEGVKNIGNHAFFNCKNLKEITIPASVTVIDSGAFNGCISLNNVYFMGNAPRFYYTNSTQGYVNFKDVVANCYYPFLSEGWTESIMQNYGGTLSWSPSCLGKHKTQEHEGKAPTCEESGWAPYITCENCDFTTLETIPAKHTYNQEIVDEKFLKASATCKSPAIYYKSCECGEKGTDEFTHGDVDPDGHTGGNASCNKQAVCISCRKSYGTIDATNHSGSTVTKNIKAATCSQTGYTGDTYCLDCEAKIAEGEEVAASGHKMGQWRITQDRTCTENGSMQRECPYCGEIETKELTALGHDYVNNVCKNCGGKKSSVVLSISVDKPLLSEGETATITIEVDPAYTAEWIYYYRPLTDNYDTIYLYESSDNVYVGTFSVTDQTESGIWEVKYLTLEDSNGEWAYVYNSNNSTGSSRDIYDFSAINFEVTGTNADITPPAIEYYNIDKKIASSGEVVTITAKVTDEHLSSTFYLYYKDPQNEAQYIRMSLADQLGTYMGTYSVTPESATGLWKPYWLTISDENDNSYTLYNKNVTSYGGTLVDLSSLNFEVVTTDNDNPQGGNQESYIVVFKDGYGNTLSTQRVSHGGTAIEPSIPTHELYLFNGWDKDFSNITSNEVITATWILNPSVVYDREICAGKTFTIEVYSLTNQTYTISCSDDIDFSYTLVSTGIVFTDQAYYSKTYQVTVNDIGSYLFYVDGSRATNTLTYKVRVSAHSYKNTFSWNEDHESCDLVIACERGCGQKSTLTCQVTKDVSDPTKTVHTASVQYNNETLTNTLNCNHYQVTFVNWDETILSSQYYHLGETVTVPPNPTRETDPTFTYTFNGWDKSVVNCAGETTYMATYTSNYINYTVVFKNWDGTILSSNTYHFGDTVTEPWTPTKIADETYTYSFKGWDKAVVDCAGNATYTATYTSNYIDYTVVFENWDGTILSSTTYHYGDKVTVPSDPVAPDFLGAGYAFIGWDKEITDCQGDVVYTAKFTRVYILGDVDQDEQINNKDVEYLLWHTLFPEQYPIVGDVDFNGDGTVNNKDVEYLLWHTLFPEQYPLVPKKKED